MFERLGEYFKTTLRRNYSNPCRVPRIIYILTCLTGLMRQPRSAVSDARGLDRHLLLDVAARWSSWGIVIGRHPFGSTAGVEPSRLQHSSLLPSPVIQVSCRYTEGARKRGVRNDIISTLCVRTELRVFWKISIIGPVDHVSGT